MTAHQENQTDYRIVDQKQHQSEQETLASAPKEIGQDMSSPLLNHPPEDSQRGRDQGEDACQRNWCPSSSASTEATATTTASRHTSESTRPDGSTRPPIRIPPGFEPRGPPSRRRSQNKPAKSSTESTTAASYPPPPAKQETVPRTTPKAESGTSSPSAPTNQVQQSVRPDGSVRPAVRVRPGFQVRDLPVRNKPQAAQQRTQDKYSAPSKPSASFPSSSAAPVAHHQQPPSTQAHDKPSPVAPPTDKANDVTNSGISTNPETGDREVPQSVRPDGTVRRALRVRPGFVPEDDVQVYVPRRVLEHRQQQQQQQQQQSGTSTATAAMAALTMAPTTKTDQRKQKVQTGIKTDDAKLTGKTQQKHSRPSSSSSSQKSAKSNIAPNAGTEGVDVSHSVRPDGSVRRPVKIRPGKAPMDIIGAHISRAPVSKEKEKSNQDGKAEALADDEER